MILKKIRKLNENTIYPNVCSYLFTTMAIQSDGTVVACCVDWSRKTKYGDVSVKSLKDIWHGEALKQLRLMHLNGLRKSIDSCRNCKRMPLDSFDYLDDNSDEIARRIKV